MDHSCFATSCMLNSLHIQEGNKAPAYLLAGGACACVCMHVSVCECVCASSSSSILKKALLPAFFMPHLTFPFHPFPCSHPLTLKNLELETVSLKTSLCGFFDDELKHSSWLLALTIVLLCSPKHGTMQVCTDWRV